MRITLLTQRSKTMSTNETLNRWNHKNQIGLSLVDRKTITIGDLHADPIWHEEQAAEILAMDKNTAAEIITTLMDKLSNLEQCYYNLIKDCDALEEEIEQMRNELDLLKGGALEAVRKSEEAAREMAAARAKYAPVVKRLREDGLSWNQIAEMTGVNRTTVRQWFAQVSK
nr:MAG TPA: hypothetical protein [Bacteriophage sp.]